MSDRRFTHPHDPYVDAPVVLGPLRPRQHRSVPASARLPVDQLDPHSRRLRNVSAMDRAEITESQVRNARHAYYFANISYVDDWVGALLATLDTCGMADNTVVVFTADHGDMLGERGLWYKMNFFEGAAASR